MTTGHGRHSLKTHWNFYISSDLRASILIVYQITKVTDDSSNLSHSWQIPFLLCILIVIKSPTHSLLCFILTIYSRWHIDVFHHLHVIPKQRRYTQQIVSSWLKIHYPSVCKCLLFIVNWWSNLIPIINQIFHFLLLVFSTFVRCNNSIIGCYR